MEKKTVVTREVKETVIEDVICNKCGRSCKVSSGAIYGLKGNVSGGYESTHLNDLTSYEFDMCEQCLTDLFKTFKYPVFECAQEL